MGDETDRGEVEESRETKAETQGDRLRELKRNALKPGQTVFQQTFLKQTR